MSDASDAERRHLEGLDEATERERRDEFFAADPLADLGGLLAVAAAATPGPWTVNPNNIMVQLDPPHDSVCDVIESSSADAAFIAAANPAVVSALVERLKTAEAGWSRSAFVVQEQLSAAYQADKERDSLRARVGVLETGIKQLADEWDGEGIHNDEDPPLYVCDHEARYVIERVRGLLALDHTDTGSES